MRSAHRLTVAGMILASVCAPVISGACTRVVYVGENGDVITGRTLDWKGNIATNLYVMPRGIERSGYDVGNTVSWKSRYGSVVAVGYDMGVCEGMNEKGLVCNLLYLPGTVYSMPGDSRPVMSSALWAQYVLDNFATVSEAVGYLKLDRFRVDAPDMPDGNTTCLHMAISDATGNNAIIEYTDGVLELHEGHEYKVLTNSPPFDQQLSVNRYWENVGGMNMLPGTNRSYDRFIRASFYINSIPRDASHQVALAGVSGVLDNCSVPVGISIAGQPEISTTNWRSVSDQKYLVYYYKPTYNPAVMWVDLKEFNLEPGSPIMKLDLMNPSKTYGGNVRQDMSRSNGFTPLFRIPGASE